MLEGKRKWKRLKKKEMTQRSFDLLFWGEAFIDIHGYDNVVMNFDLLVNR